VWDAQNTTARSSLKLLPIVKHVQNAVELHFGGIAQIVSPANSAHGCHETLAAERAGGAVRRLLAAATIMPTSSAAACPCNARRMAARA